MENLKIIVTSDTHGSETALEKLILKNQNAHMLIHLGDGETEFFKMKHKFKNLKMIIVKGNCDLNIQYEPAPETRIIQINKNLKILACHGHTFNVKQSFEPLIQAAKKNNVDLALFGHTHNKFLEVKNNLTVLNPGSLTQPRSFNPSFAIISYNNKSFDTKIYEF